MRVSGINRLAAGSFARNADGREFFYVNSTCQLLYEPYFHAGTPVLSALPPSAAPR